MKIKALFCFLLGLLTVFGGTQCTTLDYQIHLAQFREALSLVKKGRREEARPTFTKLCNEKHKASCLVLGKKVSWYAGLAIMQGASLDSRAKFVVASRKSEQLTIFALNQSTGRWIWPDKRLVMNPDYSDSSLTHVEFMELKGEESYQLVVLNERMELLDFRNFKTLNSQGSKLKLAVASCMRDDLKNIEEIWLDMENRGPELIFMIGDNSYIDIGLRDHLFKVDKKRIWQRHMETRMKLRVFRWQNLVPVLAVWDDHDYGQKDKGKDFESREESEKIFQSFFLSGIGNKHIPQGPGLSFAVKLRGHNFIFLDNRSFRDDKKNRNGAHFGRKQNQWLGEHFSREELNWLISGDQFFGGYHPFESFQGNHPAAFSAFLSKLKETQNKFVFVSGDRHLSEVIKVPWSFLRYTTYEFTSSPMHSSVYPGASDQYKNPNRLHSVDGKWNYLFFELEKLESEFKIKLESRGLSNEVYFKDNLVISH